MKARPLALLAILLSSPAWGQERYPSYSIGPSGAEVPEAARAPLTPCQAAGGELAPDDFDPLMREWYRKAQSGGECFDLLLHCEPRKSILAYGGDRMASYLIHLFEESQRQGCSGATYLWQIGLTRSPVGINYLLKEVDQPRVRSSDRWASKGLKHCKSQRAIDWAVATLSKPDRADFHAVAVSTIRANAIDMGRLLPSDEALLRRLEQQPGGLQIPATKALKDLEARGIIQQRPHPPELDQFKS